jgi:hypothetical protein
MDKRTKKPFSETTAGKIFQKVGGLLPDLAKDLIPGKLDDFVIDNLFNKVDKAAAADPNNPELQKFAHELKLAEQELRRQAQEQLHQREMEAMRQETEVIIAEITDTQNARSREIEFMKNNGGKRDWMMGWVGITVMVAFIASIVLLSFWEVPETNKDILYSMVGSLGTLVVIVVGYYYGSSKGSKTKDQALIQKNNGSQAV